MVIVVMGVSGAGKTTTGEALAKRLGWKFFDGDDFHSQAAKQKMHAGVPLTDEDRKPWLASLRQAISDELSKNEGAVFACSALKSSYRQELAVSDDVHFVYLRISVDEAERRLQNRTGHFMPATLVASQFATLEDPAEHALPIDGEKPVNDIVQEIVTKLQLT